MAGSHFSGSQSFWWPAVILVAGSYFGGRQSFWWDAVTLVAVSHFGHFGGRQ